MPIISRGGAAAPELWTVEYEADFTTATPDPVTNGSPHPVNGKTWTGQIPGGVVTSVALDAADGLTFAFNGTNANSNLGLGDYNCPRLQIAVYGAGGLVPGVAIDDTLAFQIQLGSDGLDDDWQVYGMHLSDGTTGGNWIENSTAYITAVNAVAPHLATEIQVGTGGQAHASLGANPDPGMREIVWYAGSCGFVTSHNQAADWADPLSSSGIVSGVLSSATNTVPAAAPALNVTIANATICLHAFYPNAGGGRSAFNCQISKFRVLKRVK